VKTGEGKERRPKKPEEADEKLSTLRIDTFMCGRGGGKLGESLRGKNGCTNVMNAKEVKKTMKEKIMDLNDLLRQNGREGHCKKRKEGNSKKETAKMS